MLEISRAHWAEVRSGMWGLTRKVRALAKQGSADEALRLVRSTTNWGLRQEPHHLNLVGVCLAKAGLLDEARKTFQRILSSNRRSPEVLNNQGNLMLLKECPGDARDYYLEAINLSPWRVEPRFNLVLAYLDMGHFEKALGAYEDYVALCKVHRSLKAFCLGLLGLTILMVLFLLHGRGPA
ncbi:MAG: tetratricopeptide repeat protein [Bacillota bacterium]|jgi:Flp pilus assembly protein TadD